MALGDNRIKLHLDAEYERKPELLESFRTIEKFLGKCDYENLRTFRCNIVFDSNPIDYVEILRTVNGRTEFMGFFHMRQLAVAMRCVDRVRLYDWFPRDLRCTFEQLLSATTTSENERCILPVDGEELRSVYTNDCGFTFLATRSALQNVELFRFELMNRIRAIREKLVNASD